LLAVAARLIPGLRIIDDAYITFRYARNLLAGHGLVYNSGEAVLGTTTPLFALLMAGMGLLSGGDQAPFPTLAVLVNAIADGFSCWLLIRTARQLKHEQAGIAAALIWAIAPWSVTFAIGGMETSVFVALAISTFYLDLRGRPVGAALCASLCLLCRPDALLFIAPLLVERLRRILPEGRLNRSRQPVSWREGVAFGVPLVAWLILATAYYGTPIPHTIAAKSAAYHLPAEAGLVRLLQHFATPFLGDELFGGWWIAVGLIVFPALYAIGVFTSLRRTPRAWPFLFYPLVHITAFAIANPLLFRWYLTPPLLFYFLGIFLGVAALGEVSRQRWLLPLAGVAALALTLSGWTLQPDHGPQRPAPRMAYIKLELLYQEAADTLSEMAKPDDILAAGDIGALGYWTNMRVVDTVGLISPSAAKYYPLPASSYVINIAIPSALVLDLEPDWLVMLESYGRETLLKDSQFLARYGLVHTIPTDIYESHGMLIFRRNAP
jgi:hypothetical protein